MRKIYEKFSVSTNSEVIISMNTKKFASIIMYETENSF